MSQSIVVFFTTNSDGSQSVTIADPLGTPYVSMAFAHPTAHAVYTQHADQGPASQSIPSVRAVSRALGGLLRGLDAGKITLDVLPQDEPSTAAE